MKDKPNLTPEQADKVADKVYKKYLALHKRYGYRENDANKCRRAICDALLAAGCWYFTPVFTNTLLKYERLADETL